MRETVAAFQKRTGLAYAPAAPALAAGGRPLRPREACPTLFRYPGPEGLRDFLHGSLRRLAPAGRGYVWLSSAPRARGTQPRAASLFGSLALLEPLRLSPCVATESGAYLGANLPAQALPGLVFVPPALLRSRIPWESVASVEDVVEHARGRYEQERAAALEGLNRYLEELDALQRAGAPRLERPWCTLPASVRRARLASHGVRPEWTV